MEELGTLLAFISIGLIGCLYGFQIAQEKRLGKLEQHMNDIKQELERINQNAAEPQS